MPKVSKIEQQKKRKSRFNVFVDGKFLVGVSEKDLVEAGIYKDKELSQKDLENLKKESLKTKVKEKALKLLSIRPRSVLELTEKLEEKGYPTSEIKKTISYFKKEGLLDDKKFAHLWVENRKKFKPLGKRRLSLELRRKKIKEDIIEKEISKIKSKEEVEQAKDLAGRRVKLYNNLEKLKKREKIIDFLSRRGYNWDVIKEAIERLKF